MKAFLPALVTNTAPQQAAYLLETAGQYCNMIPALMEGGISIVLRSEYTDTSIYTPSATANRGRGVFAFSGEYDLYLDEDTYYYDGGSQDLTATTAPGYAGNTGFNSEYTASFVRHPIGGAPSAVVIVNAGHTSTNASANHGNVWWTASASIAPASISDADLPCNNGVSITRGGASLDGYFFVGDVTGKIYNSDLNDITSWTATNFLTAEREPDIGIYVGKHHDTVVYIGTRSVEFFYNAGNSTGSPLSRRQDVSYRIGCYYPNSVVETGDEIYFIGSDHSGQARIYKIQNFQLIPISTPLMDVALTGIQSNYPDISVLEPLNDRVFMSWGFLGGIGGLYITNNSLWTYWWSSATGTFHRIGVAQDETHRGGLQSTWAALVGVVPVVSHNGLGGVSGNSVNRIQLANGRVVYEGSLGNDGMDDWGNTGDPQAWILFQHWDGGTDAKKRINSVKVITRPTAYSIASRDPFNAELRWDKKERTNTDGLFPPSNTGTNAFGSNGRTLNLNVRGGAQIFRMGTTRGIHFLLDLTGSGHGPVSFIIGLEIDYEVVGE